MNELNPNEVDRDLSVAWAEAPRIPARPITRPLPVSTGYSAVPLRPASHGFAITKLHVSLVAAAAALIFGSGFGLGVLTASRGEEAVASAPKQVAAAPAERATDDDELAPLTRSRAKRAVAPVKVAAPVSHPRPVPTSVAARPVSEAPVAASSTSRPPRSEPRSRRFSDEPADPDNELKRPSMD